jgi:hypothetical protein
MHKTILQTRFVLSWLDCFYAQVKDICEISEMSPHPLAYKLEAQMRVEGMKSDMGVNST